MGWSVRQPVAFEVFEGAGLDGGGDGGENVPDLPVERVHQPQLFVIVSAHNGGAIRADQGIGCLQLLLPMDAQTEDVTMAARLNKNGIREDKCGLYQHIHQKIFFIHNNVS